MIHRDKINEKKTQTYDEPNDDLTASNFLTYKFAINDSFQIQRLQQ